MTSPMEKLAARLAATTGDHRFELWTNILQREGARSVLELVVWRGDFAAYLLSQCPQIERYFMIDPWRPLEGWNKPLNMAVPDFEAALAHTIEVTDFAAERRIFLRGTTVEVIEQIPDDSLDVAYIDGDHTLRGIAIDLIRTWPKVRPGGILGGDDYTRSIWQHSDTYEPTLVCPFAAYFAEAQCASMVVLPYNQFAIVKPSGASPGFSLHDATGAYGDRALLGQVKRPDTF